MSFPGSPTNGQQATEGGRLYAWDGYAWSLVSNVSAHAASHASGGSDAVALAASQITSGTIDAARLGSGTASSATFLRGDGTWAAAGSTSASDLTSGTLSEARLNHVPFHPFLLMGG